LLISANSKNQQNCCLLTQQKTAKQQNSKSDYFDESNFWVKIECIYTYKTLFKKL
jgi:hypothetical protein